MKRGLGILWVAISVVSVVLPMRAGASDLLYNCGLGGNWDSIDRGFYIENYAGLTLDTMMMYYSTSGQVGNYIVTITAHEGTYDGPVLRSTDVSFDQTGVIIYPDFQSLPINSNMTIAFVQTLSSGPPDGVVFYGVGACELGDAECARCPGIVETEDTTPPLSTFRRNGVQLAVWGRALTPVQPDSWGGMKALYR